MPKTDKPVVLITVGDFNGIGPEVTLKSVNHPSVRKACHPVLIGPAGVFEFYSKKFHIPLHLSDFHGSAKSDLTIPIIETSTVLRSHINPGKLSKSAGIVASQAITSAVHAIKARLAHAIVTAPVSKQALRLAGTRFPGQTEMVQKLSGSARVAMMLVSQTMRVGLVTIHIPIKKISSALTKQLLRERIDIIHSALKTDWGIRSPRLAVLGLNPHASEGGDIGNEDITVIQPVIRELQKRRMKLEGPFAADAFFGKYKPGVYDAIIAMYHDQGLIPLKMSSFGNGVNISVGLNVVRTSPDHGTAFDIAGKGIANPGSMIEAIKLAAIVAANRGLVQ